MAGPLTPICKENAVGPDIAAPRPTTATTQFPTAKEILEILNKLHVSEFEEFLPTLLLFLAYQCDNLKAGRIKRHIKAWQHITKDPEILSCVSGVKVELNSPPCISHRHRKFSASEEHILNTEIQKLMKKEVLEIARPEKGQVISPTSLTPKPDGSYRMILNLKKFNEHVTYHHFKMETLHTITSLIERNCFMASLDIKDAHYSVEVASEHRKHFRFEFNGNLLEYQALPNGLACCPRVLTKLLKPALTELHKEGIIATAYIDDLYLQGG